MSEWNSLENELRQWTLRQPSPDLRERLFPRAAVALRSPQRRFVDLTQWLVPALGCFLLVMGTLSTRYTGHAVLAPYGTNFLGDENSAAYTEMVLASGAEHSDKNSLPVGRVEWSFGGRASTSELGSVPESYTNKIIQ